ncbi:MAG: hypothetical protein ACOY46_20630 [Bacillota bacterium]
MFGKVLMSPKVHEILGRTIVNTVKLGLASALLFSMQDAFYKSGDKLIREIGKLPESV